MWISRDKTENGYINISTEEPFRYEGGEHGGGGEMWVLDVKEFKKTFPNTNPPRKGSCREISHLKIVEVEK